MAPRDAKPKEKFVGRSVPRLEDRPLVLGQGRFAADVSFPHQLHMRVVRSPHAHGRIRAIDGVIRTETHMYLKLVKQTYNWGSR